MGEAADTARMSPSRRDDPLKPRTLKAIAFRPQDQQDIERLLALYGAHIDLGRVRRTVAEFAHAMEEPERVGDFERLVDRASLA